MLAAFVSRVESLVDEGVLTPAEGDALISSADRLTAAIEASD